VHGREWCFEFLPIWQLCLTEESLTNRKTALLEKVLRHDLQRKTLLSPMHAAMQLLVLRTRATCSLDAIWTHLVKNLQIKLEVHVGRLADVGNKCSIHSLSSYQGEGVAA